MSNVGIFLSQSLSDTGKKGDNLTYDQTPILNGFLYSTGETHPVQTSVTLYQNDVEIGHATIIWTANTVSPSGDTQIIGWNGIWSFEVAPILIDGDYTFSVNYSGASSEPLASTTITIDTKVAVPSVQLSAATDSEEKGDNLTNITLPAFDGSAEIGSVVKVFINDQLLGIALTDDQGHWSLDPDQWKSLETMGALKDGDYTVKVQATDVAGNVSDQSEGLSIRIDTQKPNAPSLLLSAESDSGFDNNDCLTNNTLPTLVGQAEKNSTVEVFLAGQSVGTADVDGDGAWHLDLSTVMDKDLLEGEYTFEAKTTDQAGNVSDTSTPLKITIDTTVDQPTLRLSSTTDSWIKDDNITNFILPVIEGTAEADSRVKVFLDGKYLATAIANTEGQWSLNLGTLGHEELLPLVLLDEGTHTFTAQATDKANNVSELSSDLDIVVDTHINAPLLSLDTASDGGVKGDFLTNMARPMIKGQAEAGSTVVLYLDKVFVGTTIADFEGNWTVDLSKWLKTPLKDGEYTFTAKATDQAGNTSPLSERLAITIDTQPPSTPTVVLSGATDSGTLGDSRTNATVPQFTGTAEAGSTVEVFCGQTSVGQAIANDQGIWQLTSNTTLTGGDYTVTAKATDIAGNNSNPSEEWTLTIDKTAPTVDVLTVLPTVRNSSVSSLTFSFSEAVADFGSDAIKLMRNGQALNLDGATVSTSDRITWTLTGLSDVTALAGQYTVTVGGQTATITDVANNGLANSDTVSWLTGYTAIAPAPIVFEHSQTGVTRTGTLASELLTGTGNDDVLRGAAGDDTLKGGVQTQGSDTLNGGLGNDQLITSGGTDLLQGGDGNDNLQAGANHDQLEGGSGQDTLVGGGGNDLLIGGTGADQLTGNSGNDTFVMQSLDAADQITDFEVSHDLLDLRAILKQSMFGTDNSFAKYQKFVKLSSISNGLAVQIDADGMGSGKVFTTVAVLQGNVAGFSSTNVVI